MSSYEKIKDYIIKDHPKKIKQFFKSEKPEFIKTLLNSLENGKTLLNVLLSQSKLNFDLVKLFLEYGANPNGITLSGNTLTVPLGEAIKNPNIWNIEVMDLVELLYQYGLDINYYGNDTYTALLTSIDRCFRVSKTSGKMNINLIEYLLKKGSDPNIKNSLAIRYVINMMNTYNEYDVKKISPLIDLLNYYGADPYLTGYDGLTTISLINSKKFPDTTQSSLMDKIFLNLDNVLNECKDVLQIKKIARAFKIKFDENKITEVCQCIKYIRENFQKIDFDEVIELRKVMNGFDCINDSTFLTFTDLNEYNKDDIVKIPVGKNNYCFHKNEMLNLIQTKKNPYTGQELFKSPKEFLEFFKNVENIPNADLTLEEAVQIFNQKMLVEYSLDDFLDFVAHICKPVNIYIDYKNLKNLNLEMIKYFGKILNDIQKGNLNFKISPVSINSIEYNHLKLYQLLNEVVSIIKRGNETLTPFNLTYSIEKILTYKSFTDRIVNIIINYNIDLYDENNIQTINKTKIQNLPLVMLKNFDGNMIPVDISMINEILQFLIREGGSEIPDLDTAILFWNNVLGYFLRI